MRYWRVALENGHFIRIVVVKSSRVALEIVSAGLHWSFKISKQMAPAKFRGMGLLYISGLWTQLQLWICAYVHKTD
jgi:hypothetical protein